MIYCADCLMPVASKGCQRCGHEQRDQDSVFSGLDARFQEKSRLQHVLARAGATGFLVAIFVVALGHLDSIPLPL